MLQLSFVNFKRGSYILIEGKSDTDRFYIIQSGQVQIAKQKEVVAEEEGNLLGPGDFLGVVACMAHHSQIETAIAVTDVVLIAVHYTQFPELIEKNTPIAMKIIYSFSRKMRYLDEALTRITLKRNIDTDISHLFTIGEYYLRMSKFELALYAYYHYLKEKPNGQYAETARKRFMAIKSTGVKAPIEMLEPDTKQMVRVYNRESMVFCECQSGTELYIIQKGRVKISKIVDNSEVLLAVLREGDMFGEMALLENKPRSATAITAAEECQLLAVNRQNFNQMVATQPQLIARLTTTLADRIWAMYKQLANTLIPVPLEKMYDMLSIQLEKLRIQPGSGKQHTFLFGPAELAKMCSIPKEQVAQAIAEFLMTPIVRSTDDSIIITDTLELSKQTAYFKKMQEIEQARKQSRANEPTYRGKPVR
ncbi:cyclic nucleotide-binding domain-containing protein [Treponema sp. OMZ 857]|uniref:cyclic nucleotide-binding domain-containing protein n=1 Tax=Treponema sp. OMZ 857 TaxID=1643513 RepID=UPI0020A4B21D|nr:cyclic nucleotide-binding domain-containing protein [Treponema sp. OMZ 857]UTC43509.1 cyclic nucleotide-binding domain-containing protein [Treponema sp. OMZ 857]